MFPFDDDITSKLDRDIMAELDRLDGVYGPDDRTAGSGYPPDDGGEYLTTDDDGGDEGSDGMDDEDDAGTSSEKGALYDAYNLLHSLAQDFQKPFDAPAVVVVGHQSSGKSALIEALMGFQFNQVGGGTKTRRPVALRMQYNPRCSSPRCFLQGDDGVERPMSLVEIQEHIEAENRRLENGPRPELRQPRDQRPDGVPPLSQHDTHRHARPHPRRPRLRRRRRAGTAQQR
ncbi:hypothetical protein THAOC_18392, partial [Thalassiosira oceanica]